MMSSRMLASCQRVHILLTNLTGKGRTKNSKRLRLQIGPPTSALVHSTQSTAPCSIHACYASTSRRGAPPVFHAPAAAGRNRPSGLGCVRLLHHFAGRHYVGVSPSSCGLAASPLLEPLRWDYGGASRRSSLLCRLGAGGGRHAPTGWRPRPRTCLEPRRTVST